jgi:hypothetical protein
MPIISMRLVLRELLASRLAARLSFFSLSSCCLSSVSRSLKNRMSSLTPDHGEVRDPLPPSLGAGCDLRCPGRPPIYPAAHRHRVSELVV